MSDDRHFGTVDRLRPTFGFVRSDDGSSIFFAASDTSPRGMFDGLAVGDRVSFLSVMEPRGVRGFLVERA